jgi:hypothetical protein
LRRQWNDWRTATYQLSDIENLKWDWASGGIRPPTPYPFVHGHVLEILKEVWVIEESNSQTPRHDIPWPTFEVV